MTDHQLVPPGMVRLDGSTVVVPAEVSSIVASGAGTRVYLRGQTASGDPAYLTVAAPIHQVMRLLGRIPSPTPTTGAEIPR